MRLINDSFNAKAHLGLSGGTLSGQDEILSQIDHLADKNGLTAVRQTNVDYWQGYNSYGHTITFEPYQ